ncbi:MAG: DUF4145 domain-containing protein [Myxococcota bacterium]|nr:DUF4145 domain-containing protein [Myxococcota bacterium]
MDPGIADLTRKLANLIKDQDAGHEFMFAHEYAARDANAAANKARIVLEAVVVWLVGDQPDLQSKMKDKREGTGLSAVLNDSTFRNGLDEANRSRIIDHMQAIAKKGNRGSHWQGDRADAVTREEAMECLRSLDAVINWFVEGGPDARKRLGGPRKSEPGGRHQKPMKIPMPQDERWSVPRLRIIAFAAAVLAAAIAFLLLRGNGPPPSRDADVLSAAVVHATPTVEPDVPRGPDHHADADADGDSGANADAGMDGDATAGQHVCTTYCSGPAGRVPLVRFEAGDERVESAQALRALVLGQDPLWFALVVGESGVGKTDLADWLRCEACREGIAVDFWDAADPGRTANDFLAEHGKCGDRSVVSRPEDSDAAHGVVKRCVVVVIKFDAWKRGERNLVLQRLRTEVHPPGVNVVVTGRPPVEDEVRRALNVKATAMLVPVGCDETWAWLESQLGGPDQRQQFGEFLRTRQFPLDPVADAACPVQPWRTFRVLLLLLESFRAADGVFPAWGRVTETQIREVVRIPEMVDPVALVLDSIDRRDRFSPRLCQEAVQRRGIRDTVVDAREVCERLADDPLIVGPMARAEPDPADRTARAFLRVSRAVEALRIGDQGRSCEGVLADAAGRTGPRVPDDQLGAFAAMAATSPLGFTCPQELADCLCTNVGGDAKRAMDLLRDVDGLSVPDAVQGTSVPAVPATGDAVPPDVISGGAPESCPELIACLLRGSAASGSSPTGLASSPPMEGESLPLPDP